MTGSAKVPIDVPLLGQATSNPIETLDSISAFYVGDYRLLPGLEFWTAAGATHIVGPRAVLPAWRLQKRTGDCLKAARRSEVLWFRRAVRVPDTRIINPRVGSIRLILVSLTVSFMAELSSFVSMKTDKINGLYCRSQDAT